MAYSAPYYALIDFFPEIDTDEATQLVDLFEGIPELADVFLLSRSAPAALGSILESDSSFFDTFWTGASSRAGEIYSSGQPEDSDNPTPDEQRVIDAMLPTWYASWPVSKTPALKWLADRIAEQRASKNQFGVIEDIAKLDATTILPWMKPEFYELLASYYIFMDQQYLKVATKKYRFLGQVIDADGKPRKNVRVACSDKNVYTSNRSFGFTTTNSQGYYRINFGVAEGLNPDYKLEFTFSNENLNEQKLSLYFDPNTANIPVQSALTFNAVKSTSTTIADTGIAIPADVQAYLTAHYIAVSRLEDIRRLGGLKNLPTNGIDKSNPNLLKLDGLASLEIVQQDVAKNKTFYDRGFAGIAEIALSSRSTFVEANTDLLGDYGAAQLHYVAQAAHLYSVNSLASAHTHVPGKKKTAPPDAMPCNCPDCKSGTSPLAYLADLISFVESNIKQGDLEELASFEFLEDSFHQKFAELPISCDQLNEALCQNRIATEVLRSFQLSEPPAGQQATDLVAAVTQYLTETYQLLLNKLGTSYAEIRAIRGVTDTEQRKRLTERLGIVADDGNDTLAQLFIDLSDPNNIVEGVDDESGPAKSLEGLFGVRDTKRDTLSTSPVGKVEQWKKARLREIWEDQDGLANMYWNVSANDREVIIDPDIVTVDDIRDPSVGNVVFDLWDKRRTWIDKEWELLDGQTTAATVQDAFAEDGIIVAYGSELPIVSSLTYTSENPDTGFSAIFPVDVEASFTANGNTYFKVTNPILHDHFNGTISVTGQPVHSNSNLTVRNCATMMQRLCDDDTLEYADNTVPSFWPAAALDVIGSLRLLLPLAKTGNTGALGTLAQLGFQLPGATRLVELFDKNEVDPQNYLVDGNLSGEEWAEFKNLLVNVLKRKLSESGGVWWTEESSNSPGEAVNLLGPDNFWASLRGPKVAIFPYASATLPFIDPDLVSITDLPEITARSMHAVSAPDTTALDLLQARQDTLSDERTELVNAHGISFNDLLNTAFQDPGLAWDNDPDQNDYLKLLNRFADPVWSGWAKIYTTERLKIEEEDLRLVVTLGTAEDNEETLTEADENLLYSMLLKAHKLLVHYAGSGSWVSEEHGVAKWLLRKAALPLWRATAEQRNTWLKALAENSEAPIVDGDLIGPSDLLLVPNANTPAYSLWQARLDEVDSWLSTLSAGDGALTTLSEFDTLTRTNLGFVEVDLQSFREAAEAGVDIRPRLAQLNLTPGEFNQLLTCRDLLTTPPPNFLTDEEKTSVRHILAQVKKRRQALVYRLEEVAPTGAQPVITLSQDHFKISDSSFATFPPTSDHELRPWLAEASDLVLWRRKLQGRIDQEKSTLDAWHEILFQVDEAMMVHLRDALVRAYGDPNMNLVQNARQLGNMFLIDLENNCCFKTNRVAAAIETLQQLLWKTRNGDILTDYPSILYVGGDFDEAWTWMGSYANWRAAMFVFLYPENVLIPGLRKVHSPAFRQVLEATQNNRQFSPANTCSLVHDFKDYLRDVTELELACSIQANIFNESGCGSGQNTRKKLTLTFAKAKTSKKAYYTIMDTADADHVVQSNFWTEIPYIEAGADICGCDLYINAAQKIDHIYLFYCSPDSADKFYAIRFSNEERDWESNILEFQVNTDDLKNEASGAETQFIPDEFDTTINALCVLQNALPQDTPMLAISLWNRTRNANYTFFQRLTPEGDKLASGEPGGKWNTRFSFFYVDDMYVPADGIWDLIGTVKDFLVVHYDPNDAIKRFLFFLLHDVAPNQSFRSRVVRWELGPNGELISNSLFGAGTPDVIKFTANNIVISNLVYDRPAKKLHFMVSDDTEPFDQQPMFTICRTDVLNIPLAPSSQSVEVIGGVPNGGMRLATVNTDGEYAGGFIPLVYQLHTDDHIRISEIYTVAGEFQWENEKIRLTPRMVAEPLIGADLSTDDLEVMRTNGQTDWELNSDPNTMLREYVKEAEYFVPLQFALQLQTNGYYQEALDWFRSIYDFTLPLADRKISYLLLQEETLGSNATLALDWYADPLNPHAIAALRQNTYTRYTILSIVYCMLDQADAQFTMDNSESVPRARELYEDALALLKLLVPYHDCPISDATDMVDEYEVPMPWVGTWTAALERLEPLSSLPGFGALVGSIGDVMANSDPIAKQLAEANNLIDAALAANVPVTMEELLGDHQAQLNAATTAALGSMEADAAILHLAQGSAQAFSQTMTAVTGLETATLEGEDIPWLIDDTATSPFEHGFEREYFNLSKGQVLQEYSEAHPAQSLLLNDPFPNIWISGVSFSFCVVPNPIIGALVMKAEVELFKVHNCMNIAGIVRELDPFAAPTDSTTGIQVIGAGGGALAVPSDRSLPPSAYRYRTLVDRAKQLVAMAQQVESAFLGTLEKLDAERYSQLKAEQDIETSKANIKLQDLNVKESDDGVKMAELQRDRANLQVNGLQGMIDAGLLGSELGLINTYIIASIIQQQILQAKALLEATNLAMSIASAGGGVTAPASVAATAVAAFTGYVANSLITSGESALININKSGQILSIISSFERRKQEWDYQKSLAQQDVKIGEQGIALANDRVKITGQERVIAGLQNDQAKATLDFLKNKFTNSDLYEWMSGVLEDVYASLLQHATSMALIAQRQLAFERQLDLPQFIRTDYWVVDTSSIGSVSSTNGSATDRRGLTGSSRLLKDLTDLDQYAFTTNSPKLQMSKTISINEIAPEEVMRLRDTGIMSFRTTHEMFDRDYPGHYLRLIKKVNVTVIALNSPTKGIRATLTNGGVSRVITGGTIFQERVINRYPEQIALSGGVCDYGVFQLQSQGEFLDPFENTGVDTFWEFRMEKAANPFNFDSVADVLLTIEYEAMNSFTYRSVVVKRLGKTGTATLGVSMKNNLPDQWFDLHNPGQTDDPYKVSFSINQRDLVPNISSPLNIDRLLVYTAMKDGSTFNYEVEMTLTAPDGTPSGLGSAGVVDNIANLSSTSLLPNTGNGPVGTWSIGFTPPTIGIPTNPFDADLVDDIFIIFTYSGDSPEYSD